MATIFGDLLKHQQTKNGPHDNDKEKQYTPHDVVKDFKVFSYSCRSGLTKQAPQGWDIRNEKYLGLITNAIHKEFSIDDMIDSVT